MRPAGRTSLAVLLSIAWLHVGPAQADMVLLSNGGLLKATSYRTEGEGDVVWLTLSGGGELAVPRAAIEKILPDEIAESAPPSAPGSHAPHLRDLAVETARRHGLDPNLLLAVISVESAFEPRATSPKGALGLMQLMPRTAAELGIINPLDAAQNLDGGTRYLRSLIAQYEGDLPLALAAYNAGSGAVNRHNGVPPYKETQQYVRRVLSRYKPRT